jgi:hypothetical protein
MRCFCAAHYKKNTDALMPFRHQGSGIFRRFWHVSATEMQLAQNFNFGQRPLHCPTCIRLRPKLPEGRSGNQVRLKIKGVVNGRASSEAVIV